MMTKNQGNEPDFTFTPVMEQSERYKGVVALGKKLVDELGLDQSVDTLGRWMAHHVAELIASAESANPADAMEARKKCFNAVLKLWAHRAELPGGRRPFEELEPIARTIASLDPDNDSLRHFGAVAHPASESESTEVDKWLELVRGLDYTAKLTIGYCLRAAAQAANDKSADWVALAEAAGVSDSTVEIVFRFVSRDGNDGEPDVDAPRRHDLQKRLDRLDGFLKIANIVRSDIEAKLQMLGYRQGSSE
jgi:hypothetical protein